MSICTQDYPSGLRLEMQRLDQLPAGFDVVPATQTGTEVSDSSAYPDPHTEPVEAGRHVTLYSEPGCASLECIATRISAAKIVVDQDLGTAAGSLDNIILRNWVDSFASAHATASPLQRLHSELKDIVGEYALNPEDEWIRLVATGLPPTDIVGSSGCTDTGTFACFCHVPVPATAHVLHQQVPVLLLNIHVVQSTPEAIINSVKQVFDSRFPFIPGSGPPICMRDIGWQVSVSDDDCTFWRCLNNDQLKITKSKAYHSIIKH